ncbi:MAG: hypothetical protein V4494_01195 [Chlamydiota bacterium]
MPVSFDVAKSSQKNFNNDSQEFRAPKTRSSQMTYDTISTLLPEKRHGKSSHKQVEYKSLILSKISNSKAAEFLFIKLIAPVLDFLLKHNVIRYKPMGDQ